MSTWKRKSQEQPGNYLFAGTCYLTAEVDQTIPKSEIHAILADLHKAVQEENGIDYLQVYESKDGTKVWVIDQVP